MGQTGWITLTWIMDLRGEADFTFPLYLDRLESGGDTRTIPGCIYHLDGQVFETPRQLVQNLDETALPAYELFDLERYLQHGISPGILTKRGCAFHCTYCPYRSLEGSRYRLKSAGRVVDEIEAIRRSGYDKMLVFCENNFNVPKQQAEGICQEIIDRRLEISWGTGDLRPMGVTDEFCRLMSASGCNNLSLSVESGSDVMLKRMQRGYSAADVRQSLECLEKSGIPFGVSLMIGAPGETPETVAETLALMDGYPVPLGIWLTAGICLWTHYQEVLATAREEGQLQDDRMLFKGANYLSPQLSKSYMEDLIAMVRSKENYTIQVNQPYAGFSWENLQ